MVSATAEAMVEVYAPNVKEAEERYQEWEDSQADTEYAFLHEDRYMADGWGLDYMSTRVLEDVE